MTLGSLVADTPADRNRAVDLVRASALAAVVVGHWLMAVVYVDGAGEVQRRSLLGLSTWTHPLTWLFQVIPLFFVVGGYANALSWRHARAAGTTYAPWLQHRLQRLTGPVLPLLALWVVLPWLAHAGAPTHAMRIADRASLVPLWFIAAYVLTVALVPWTLAWWDRHRWATVAGGLVLAGLVDVVSIATDRPLVGLANSVVVWVTLHQLGYAWLDGALPGTPRRLLLAASGLLALVLLVRFGGYAESMVGVRDSGLDNTNPTRVTLAFLGVAQAGVAIALEPWFARWAARPRVWSATVATNARIMMIYLWHLTAVGLVALAAPGTPLDGLLRIEHGTPAWWWSRFVWVGLLALVTGALVLLLGRFERPPARPTVAPPLGVPLAGLLLTSLGLAWLAWRGVVWPDGSVHRAVPVLYLVLAPLLGLVGVGRVTRRRPRRLPGAGVPDRA